MDALSRADIENIQQKWVGIIDSLYIDFFTFWALAPHSSHSSFSSYTCQPLFRFLIFFYILSEVKRLLYTYNIQVVRLMNTIMDVEKNKIKKSLFGVSASKEKR